MTITARIKINMLTSRNHRAEADVLEIPPLQRLFCTYNGSTTNKLENVGRKTKMDGYFLAVCETCF